MGQDREGNLIYVHALGRVWNEKHKIRIINNSDASKNDDQRRPNLKIV